jgi:uncharacterized protein
MEPKYTLIEKVKQNIGLGLGLTVIGVSLGLVGMTAIRAYQKNHNTTYISVKGAAGIPVKADIAFWSITIRANNKKLTQGNDLMAQQTKIVYSYLIKAGLTPEEIKIEAVVPSPNYKKIYIQHENYTETQKTSEIESYNFTRSIDITTKGLDVLDGAYQGISSLLSQGIDMNIEKPAYRVTDIENRKLEVLQSAIENAHQRALLFTGFDKSKTLELSNAQSSVFQITRPEGDAADRGSYGSYDTSSVDKIAKTVVTVTFKLS